ncbi:MAG: hypothetical protein H6502_02160 [Candidatus Woesearchaeota archaeon]|nr:MAG: hypothetical protein H6502_02160 [Candidatus Woesearchaeota archaeon]
MLYLLALADALAALTIILSFFVDIPWRFTVLFAVYLLGKAAVFRRDPLSWLDGGVGAIMLISLAYPLVVMLSISCVYLLVKSVESFFL